MNLQYHTLIQRHQEHSKNYNSKCNTKVILYILTTEDGKTFNENQLKGINDLKVRMDGNWYESNDAHHIAKLVNVLCRREI